MVLSNAVDMVEVEYELQTEPVRYPTLVAFRPKQAGSKQQSLDLASVFDHHDLVRVLPPFAL